MGGRIVQWLTAAVARAVERLKVVLAVERSKPSDAFVEKDA